MTLISHPGVAQREADKKTKVDAAKVRLKHRHPDRAWLTLSTSSATITSLDHTLHFCATVQRRFVHFADSQEAFEAEDWSKGAKKDKGVDKTAKAAAAKDAKAARDALLAEEEASIASKPKPAAKAGQKTPAKKPAPVVVPTAQASTSGASTPKERAEASPRKSDIPSFEEALHTPVESFTATNIVRHELP